MNFNESEQRNISEKVTELVCAGATDEDLIWFEKFSYWIDGVFQLGLGKSSFSNCDSPLVYGKQKIKIYF